MNRLINTSSLLLIPLTIGLLITGCATPKQPSTSDSTLTEKTHEKTTMTIPTWQDEPGTITKGPKQGNTEETQVGDLRVIHRATPGNDVVSVRLVFLGGTQSYDPKQAGIEHLSLQLASQGGTKTTPRDLYNSTLQSLGSEITSYAAKDTSGFVLRTVASNFDASWELFRQVVFEPAMPQQDFTKIRDRQLASIDTQFDSPDSQIGIEANQLMFQNHPYSNRQIGTKESVTALTLEQVATFQQSLLDPSRMLLVVVGNVDHDSLLKKVSESFGRLTGSKTELPELPKISSQPNTQKQVERDLPTYYIIGYAEAPHPKDADYSAFLLGSAWLSHRLFEEIRTKRNLTYAVSSSLSGGRQSVGYLYVTAVKPVETLAEMFRVVRELKEKPITKQELEETLNTTITELYMDLETNASQAALLASNQLLRGDWRAADQMVEMLRSVTPEQILEAAKTYFQGYRFAVVGPKTDLPASAFDVNALPPEPTP